MPDQQPLTEGGDLLAASSLFLIPGEIYHIPRVSAVFTLDNGRLIIINFDRTVSGSQNPVRTCTASRGERRTTCSPHSVFLGFFLKRSSCGAGASIYTKGDHSHERR